MKEVFDLFDKREKRILEISSLLLILSFIFLFFISIREKNVYFRSFSTLSSQENHFREFNKAKLEKEKEWQSWKKAPLDIKELRAAHFYKDEEGINQLRLDLQKIFNTSRINNSQIRYSYTTFEKEKIKRVTVIFDFTGSYYSLKKFFLAVEEYPKFLIVEKIEFLDTSSEGETLMLRITMAGYYAL